MLSGESKTGDWFVARSLLKLVNRGIYGGFGVGGNPDSSGDTALPPEPATDPRRLTQITSISKAGNVSHRKAFFF
jgi:hypothetical protein